MELQIFLSLHCCSFCEIETYTDFLCLPNLRQRGSLCSFEQIISLCLVVSANNLCLIFLLFLIIFNMIRALLLHVRNLHYNKIAFETIQKHTFMQCVLNLQNCSTLWKKIQFNLLKKGRHCNMMSRWAHFRLSVQAGAFICIPETLIYVQQQINVPKTEHNVFDSTQQEAFCGRDQSMCSQKKQKPKQIFLRWTYWTTFEFYSNI